MVVSQTRIFSTTSTGNAPPRATTDILDRKIPIATTPTTTTTATGSIGAYFDLAKAKLSALVVTTTAAGFVAAGGPIGTQLDVFTACVVGTALCSSSAAAWNQIIEREQDQRMKRTQLRPLVTGALSVSQAKTAATMWGLAGGTVLYAGTDVVTAGLGVGNVALYAGLYTSLKPISIYNTWVGALVGAIPPIMGWSAATSGSIVDPEALLLGATLYLWQMPHFFALSFMHRVDYKRGGFQMIPCLEEDGQETAQLIVRYAWLLSSIPFLSTISGITSSMFALEGLVLNAYALTVAHRFQKDRTNANARKVFLTSLWYLPCLLMLLLLHSKVWQDDKERKDDVIAQYLADSMQAVRSKGRLLCLHEAAVAKSIVESETNGAVASTAGADACPIVLGTKKSHEGIQVASNVVAATADSAVSESNNVLTVKKE